LGQRADLLHLDLVQTRHVSDVVDGVHGGILLGIVVNFRHKQIGVAQCLYLVHNPFSLMEIEMSLKHTKWTYEKLRDLALQYTRKIDFINEQASAYQSARQKKIWVEISAHMETRQKRNVVYLAKVLDPDFPDYYKIGMTSLGKHTARMYDNIRKSGFDMTVLRATEVKCDAGMVEKKLLKLGGTIWAGKFEGYTEYREMNQDDLSRAHAILDEYAI
jgi:hypothetical protein